MVTCALGVLLVQRRDGTPPWSFPGGSIEPGEIPTQAAERETREETGLAIHAYRVLGQRHHPHTGRLLIYLAAHTRSGTAAHLADPAAHLRVAWIPHHHALTLLPDLFAPVTDHLKRHCHG